MKKLLYSCFSLLFAGGLMAQATNPTPQALPYAQNFSSMTGSSTSLPAGWVAWVASSSVTSFPTTGPTGDASVTGGTAATTANGVYDYNGKIGFLNSGSVSNAVALAINTTGMAQINVSYDAMTMRDPNARINVMALQYRVGNTGTWTTLNASGYNNNLTPNTTGTNPVNVQNRSVLLPAACNNQPEVQLRWVNKDSTGTGSRPSFAIDNVNITAQPASTNLVNLSLSQNSGTEAAQTTVTITATAASNVTTNETVDITVTGVNITAGDYILSNSTITIPSGNNSGSVTLTVVDDLLNEGLETCTISIASISSGLATGTIASVPFTIIDNDSVINMTAINQATQTQDFDLLENSGTGLSTFPFGVYILEQTPSSSANVDGLYRAGDGSSTTGDVYSFGSGTDPDRALGSISSGSFTPTMFGVQLLNSTGQIVNAIDLAYVGEQWRDGGNAGGDSIIVEYSTDATSLSNGTWHLIPALKFNSPVQSGVASALDGNLPQNRVSLSTQLTNIGNLNPGQVIWIRWTDADVVGNDHGMAIDDFVATPRYLACPEPTQQVTTLSSSAVTGNSVTLNWSGGNGPNVIVVARNGAAVSDFPQDGINYTASSVFGTPSAALGSGFVVYSGLANGGPVTVTGLNGGDTYHFAAFAYDCNPAEYNTTTPALLQETIPVIPSLSVTPASLAAFSAQANFNSTTDSITVSGSNLLNDISLQTAAPFEISTNFNGPYQTSLQIAPVAGSVAPTKVYVRMRSAIAGTFSDSIQVSTQGDGPYNVYVNGTATPSGTFPTQFQLCSGNYTFNAWNSSEQAGTYPTAMRFHLTSTMDPDSNTVMTGDYSAAYNLTGGSRINGLNNDGLAFANTGTASNGGHLGTAVLGLNTMGRNNIQVSWLAGTQTAGAGTPTPRDYRLRLEYKIGGGQWTVIPNSEYQTVGTSNGQTQSFNITLPQQCENQPEVYLQWRYYQYAANNGGSRPAIRLDSITVASAADPASVSDIVAVPLSETDTIYSNLTGALNTVSDGAQIFAFEVRDGGSANLSDLKPTEITGLSFVAGTSHSAGNFNDVFQTVSLFNGSVKLADATLNPGSIDFNGLNISVADATSQSFQIRATLSSNGLLVDKSNIQILLDGAGISQSNACLSSAIVMPTPIESADTMNVIEVSGTAFAFSGISQPITVNQPFTLTLSAVDFNGNIDRDPRDAGLSLIAGSGNLTSASGLSPVNLVNGQYTWSDLVYDVVGSFTIRATDPNSFVQGDTILNAQPVCNAPSAASGINFTNIMDASMTVQWTNGNGSGRILLARKDSAVTETPNDGTSYTASSTYGTSGTELGQSFVVYDGNGSSVTISGLLPGTTYHFALFEYDCTPVKYASGVTSFGTTTTTSIEDHKENMLLAHPNPVTAGTDVQLNRTVTGMLTDITGKIIRSLDETQTVSTDGLNAGIYILKTTGGHSLRLVVVR